MSKQFITLKTIGGPIIIPVDRIFSAVHFREIDIPAPPLENSRFILDGVVYEKESGYVFRKDGMLISARDYFQASAARTEQLIKLQKETHKNCKITLLVKRLDGSLEKVLAENSFEEVELALTGGSK